MLFADILFNMKTLLLSVNRALWASACDTADMCNTIDHLAYRFNHIIMAGDFNFPNLKWLDTSANDDLPDEALLRQFVAEHHLNQIVTQPTPDAVIIDLIFISDTLNNNTVKQLPAIADSDHNALQVHIQLPLASSKTRFRRYVDYDKLKQVFSQVNWTAEFHDCITTDEYTQRLTNILRDETD